MRASLFAPTFVTQKPVHVPDVNQILLVLRMNAQRVLPLVHEFKNFGHRWWWKGRWSFREPSDEFVQEIFGTDLKMKRVPAVLDENVQQLFCVCESFVDQCECG